MNLGQCFAMFDKQQQLEVISGRVHLAAKLQSSRMEMGGRKNSWQKGEDAKNLGECRHIKFCSCVRQVCARFWSFSLKADSIQ